MANVDGLRRVLNKIHARTRARAASSKLEFELEQKYIEELWNRQRGRCAVSGISFNDERIEHAFVKHPYAPSIDRINSQGGYTRENVRLVCTCVNFGMGQWGEEVLRRVAVGMLDQDKKIPGPDDDESWRRRQDAKLAAAQRLAKGLSGDELKVQRRRIAALKRSITLGPDGLRIAAHRAHQRRRAWQTAR